MDYEKNVYSMQQSTENRGDYDETKVHFYRSQEMRKYHESFTERSGMHIQLGAKERSRKSKQTSDSYRQGTCGPLPWHYLPVIVGCITVIGLIATYFVAKRHCHLERWIFPYVSYTGTEYPESMIFGLLLNMEGFFGFVIVFLAWRFYRHMGQHSLLNMISLCLGSCSCLGVVMVGNFQVSHAPIPHYIGAAMAFIIGTLYNVLSSILTRRVYKRDKSLFKVNICKARICTSSVMVIALGTLIFAGTYKRSVDTRDPDNHYKGFNSTSGCDESVRSDKPLHLQYIDLLGSVAEWLLTACLIACLCLYTIEFKAFQNVKIVLLTPDGPLRVNNNTYSPSMQDYCTEGMQSTTLSDTTSLSTRDESLISLTFHDQSSKAFTGKPYLNKHP